MWLIGKDMRGWRFMDAKGKKVPKRLTKYIFFMSWWI